MILNALQLQNFRNYSELNICFIPGVNLILGDNAQGKTNLLEAITYLSAGKSFRTRKEAEMLRFGAEFAQLHATVSGREREQTLRAILFSGRRQRQLFRNGVKQKTAAEFSGTLPTVLFCPDDLLVLKSGSGARRRLCDRAICQLRPSYARDLEEYSRLYEHKSRILRDRFIQPSLQQTLPDFNLRMAQLGARLIYARARYLLTLAEAAEQFHGEFSGGREQLHIEYRTVSTIRDPFAPQESLFQWIMEHQGSHETAELESGQCLTGPHKDDFDVLLSDYSIKSYGSQGQTRTAAISLKLAERALYHREIGEEPVLLLDDVLSELDGCRQNFILNQIKSGQVLITCCEKNRLTDMGQVILIENGQVV